MTANVLTDPDTFFRERAENPGLLRPLGIVFLAAIAAVLPLFLVYQDLVAAGASALVVIGQAAGVIVSFFIQFIVWIIFAIVFYLISIIVGGRGSLGDTFKLTGWGFAPAILAGIVAAIGRFIALQSVAVPDLPDINLQNPDPQKIQAFSETITNFVMSVQSQTAVRIATLIVILLTIWQGIIWMYATKHARNLSLRGAIISVWIPVGLLVLFNLYNLLTGWVL